MHAEVLLRGGRVYTQAGGRSCATSVAIGDGSVMAVGDDGLEELRGPHTRVIDLRGRAVVPGFVDAHIHLASYGLTRQQLDLDQAASLDQGLALAHRASAGLADGVWLRGRGWDRNRWGRLPTARDLDGAVGDRPAALSSHDGHALWLNTAALRLGGITRETSAPPGGVIERNGHGDPSGVLFENAQELVRDTLPQATRAELLAGLRVALREAAAAGLTGIHNLEDEHALAAFRELEAADALTLRVYHGVPRRLLGDAVALGLRTGAGSERLRIGPVKLFADGALGSRTAFMLEPYAGYRDGYRGVLTLQPEELCEDMRVAEVAGLDVAVHAIGDAAVRAVLDAVESFDKLRMSGGAPERLVRIEHAQLVHPDDVPRFARLGVVASMQPNHAVADWRVADAYWGERAKHGYAWRALRAAGARLAFGTDAPVERLEPLLNLHAATTRVDARGEPAGGWYPAQRLTLAEAVEAYTLGSAMAERASQRRGRLAPGMDADLVVLEPDPFQLEPDALRETRVELTLVGGHIVHEALSA